MISVCLWQKQHFFRANNLMKILAEVLSYVAFSVGFHLFCIARSGNMYTVIFLTTFNFHFFIPTSLTYCNHHHSSPSSSTIIHQHPPSSVIFCHQTSSFFYHHFDQHRHYRPHYHCPQHHRPNYHRTYHRPHHLLIIILSVLTITIIIVFPHVHHQHLLSSSSLSSSFRSIHHPSTLQLYTHILCT